MLFSVQVHIAPRIEPYSTKHCVCKRQAGKLAGTALTMQSVPNYLEEALCTGSAGVHNALRNAFSVKLQSIHRISNNNFVACIKNKRIILAAATLAKTSRT